MFRYSPAVFLSLLTTILITPITVNANTIDRPYLIPYKCTQPYKEPYPLSNCTDLLNSPACMITSMEKNYQSRLKYNQECLSLQSATNTKRIPHSTLLDTK
jgi:hypothetical protein